MWSGLVPVWVLYLSKWARGARPTHRTSVFQFGNNPNWIKIPDEVRDLKAITIPDGSACYATSLSMAQQAGVHPQEESLVTVTSEEDKGEGLDVTMSGEMEEAKAYIDFELGFRRPVMVGVTHRDGTRNEDGITDHWVLIDGKIGDNAYSFLDVGAASTKDVAVRSRFEWDGERLKGTGSKGYVVSNVKMNVQSTAWSAHWKRQKKGESSFKKMSQRKKEAEQRRKEANKRP